MDRFTVRLSSSHKPSGNTKPLVFKNPILTASGTFGYGVEFANYGDLTHLGGIVVKGLSLKPRPGNPLPRVAETPCGMLNAVGLQNDGVESFLKNKLPRLPWHETPVIANLYATSPAEFAELAGILAATMSTADSQMLAAASSVSQNILQEFGHMKLTEKQSLFAARLTIICVSVVGVVLARDPDSSVFGIVSFAWAGFGGSFGAVVLCALFWKRCNWQGALAGMLCGGLMVFVWKYLVSPLGGVFGIYELLPAFLVSLAVCAVVSLVTPAPEADILAEFDAAK